MESIHNHFFSMSAQATGASEDQPTSDFCSRIGDVIKSAISWIVYIFTFGCVTLFEAETEVVSTSTKKKEEQPSKTELEFNALFAKAGIGSPEEFRGIEHIKAAFIACKKIEPTFEVKIIKKDEEVGCAIVFCFKENSEKLEQIIPILEPLLTHLATSDFRFYQWKLSIRDIAKDGLMVFPFRKEELRSAMTDEARAAKVLRLTEEVFKKFSFDVSDGDKEIFRAMYTELLKLSDGDEQCSFQHSPKNEDIPDDTIHLYVELFSMVSEEEMSEIVERHVGSGQLKGFDVITLGGKSVHTHEENRRYYTQFFPKSIEDE